MGGQVRVAEITGFKAATASPDLEPASNRSILGQAKGILNHTRDYINDYVDWKTQHPGASYIDKMNFDRNWQKDHNLNDYVDKATRRIAMAGVKPPKDTSQLKAGLDTYIGKDGRRGVWNGSGWDVE
jgi:hypothetical protein